MEYLTFFMGSGLFSLTMSFIRDWLELVAFFCLFDG